MPQQTREEDIQTGIGAGFLRQQFGGKPYIHAIVEILKNARDWGASQIRIATGKDFIEIEDDGEGMNRKNRNAFASINMSTAGGARQAGKFCTGTKQMLFSHCHSVEVRTAPLETPDKVFLFRFATDEYEAKALRGETIRGEALQKGDETWFRSHPTGTIIRYTLENPKSRAIKRGKDLAAELSARLPMKFGDIITVDGEALPPKNIIGRPFLMTETSSQLGEVGFEIYRPLEARSDDELRFTSHEVGEVPVASLLRMLKDPDMRSRFPAVFVHQEVCGTISASFLRDYANEDRATFKPSLVDDQRLLLLLRLMERHARTIEAYLELNLRHEKTGSVNLNPFVDRLRKLYDPKQERTGPVFVPPPEETTEDSEKEADKGGKERQRPAITLALSDAEFEPGETIRCEAKLRGDVQQKHGASTLKWHSDKSLATDATASDTNLALTLVAEELGTGRVMVEIPGTPHSATRSYEIVPRRVFRQRHERITTKVGQTITLFVTNTDRIKGSPAWMVQFNRGTIEGRGGRIQFTAKAVGAVGEEVVTAYDDADLTVSSQCTITILGEKQNELLLPIREHTFRMDEVHSPGHVLYTGPVVIIPGTDGIGTLVINTGDPAFVNAQKQGHLDVFLPQATAFEYARFVKEAELPDTGRVDRRDVSNLIREVQRLGYEVFTEIQGLRHLPSKTVPTNSLERSFSYTKKPPQVRVTPGRLLGFLPAMQCASRYAAGPGP